MEIRYSRAAFKALRRSHKHRLIREKIEHLAEAYPEMGGNVLRLKGQPEFRLRVQDWRVVFRVEGGILSVEDVGPRGSAYER